MNKKLKASNSSNSSNSMLELPTHSDATHNTNDALADIRAWHQKLVARGDRLRELAARESGPSQTASDKALHQVHEALAARQQKGA
jgi:hypothetical protein